MGNLSPASTKHEISQQAALSAAAVAAVIAEADAYLRVPRGELLNLYLLSCCLKKVPGAAVVKVPEHSSDAGILKIGKVCVKFHLNSWRIAANNYADKDVVDYLNKSKIVAPILARQVAECAVDCNDYSVVAYEYINGRSLSDLLGKSGNARDSSFSDEQMRVFIALTKWHTEQAERLGLILMGSPGDYIIEPSGKVTLTDWNKIKFK